MKMFHLPIDWLQHDLNDLNDIPKYIFPKCIFPKSFFSKGISSKFIFLKCIFFKCIFPKCIYSKCIFAKCTRLACLLSFASLFHEKAPFFGWKGLGLGHPPPPSFGYCPKFIPSLTAFFSSNFKKWALLQVRIVMRDALPEKNQRKISRTELLQS